MLNDAETALPVDDSEKALPVDGAKTPLPVGDAETALLVSAKEKKDLVQLTHPLYAGRQQTWFTPSVEQSYDADIFEFR